MQEGCVISGSLCPLRGLQGDPLVTESRKVDDSLYIFSQAASTDANLPSLRHIVRYRPSDNMSLDGCSLVVVLWIRRFCGVLASILIEA